MLNLKIMKEYKEDDSLILEEVKHGFYVLRVNTSYICIRKNGNVILDSKWQRKINNEQKQILKIFLGGMYIKEIRKDVNRGYFKTGDLDKILTY